MEKNEYIGKRVKCVEMKDEYPVPSGTEGTVRTVDSIGTIHVIWDNGSSLGLVPDVDIFEFI